MSFLLDIFNKRQPMPEVSAPQQMPTQMAMPSGGPNVGQPMPAPDPTANAAAGPLGWAGGQYQPGTALPSGGTPIPFSNGGGQQGTPGLQPAQFRHQFQQAGIRPSSMLDQLNAQMPPPIPFDIQQGAVPPMDVATAIACGIPPGGFSSGPAMPQNPTMGGASQMPAFQAPQPMPFNNRPMPQFGAPNFSLQGGMIGAPQPSPMNGMMKGMFGVR